MTLTRTDATQIRVFRALTLQAIAELPGLSAQQTLVAVEHLGKTVDCMAGMTRTDRFSSIADLADICRFTSDLATDIWRLADGMPENGGIPLFTDTFRRYVAEMAYLLFAILVETNAILADA